MWSLVDNLFLEKKLKPVKTVQPVLYPEPYHVGLLVREEDALASSVKHLSDIINKLLIAKIDKDTWHKIGEKYAELSYLLISSAEKIYNGIDSKYEKEMKALDRQINASFLKWLLENYALLINSPYFPAPVMVHHIPHYLAAKKHAKLALIVIDGLNYSQWKQLKAVLSEQDSGLLYDETTVFAWIPTVTAVSRQTLFAGKIPWEFADAINITSKEKAAWQEFWQSNGLHTSYVQYIIGLGKKKYEASREFNQPKTKVLGIVIDLVDKLAHRALLGNKGQFAALKIWLQNKYLLNMITGLLDGNFAIYITSDHGNKESVGVGRVADGVLADLKGQRVRVYDSKILLDSNLKEETSYAWQPPGMPAEYYLMLAKSNYAYINKGEIALCHGGISIEEVLVPFISM